LDLEFIIVIPNLHYPPPAVFDNAMILSPFYNNRQKKQRIVEEWAELGSGVVETD
jgi:hypothetical protein